jgi:glutaminyl-tRNA synthetase
MKNFIEKLIEEEFKEKNLKFRFSPENNGYLHIGHAKSICLNFGLAEKYGVECNLRFDDTNPSTEKIDFINPIIEDINWIGFKTSNILYTSDYYETLYDFAKILINNEDAYVCELSSEELSRYNGTPFTNGTESPFRKRSIEENLLLFERMKNGDYDEGSATLRAKIDLKSSNMLMRDPVLYRIKKHKHYRTGNKWCIYPMYDYAHPISDALERISNSLCTLEFETHREFYNWILNRLVKFLPSDLPLQTEFARLNIDYTVMSKRKLKRLVEEGFVDGWDDPRMPTISGLRRRGFTPESIKDFCDRISVTKRDSVVSYLLLEECLRNDLNKRSNRLMCVTNPIKLTIVNWVDGTEWVEVENNPEDESAGKRMVPFSGELWIENDDFVINPDKKYNRLKLDGEVRLKGAYVVKAIDYITDDFGNVIEVKCVYDPNSKSGMTLDRKVKGTIHWVSIDHGVNVEIRDYDNLFLVSDPDELDNFIDGINPNSMSINNNAIIEPYIKEYKCSDPIQMMRKGYYILDSESGKFVFNKSVSLKESYK